MKRVLTVKDRTGTFDIPSFLMTENDSLQIKLEIKNELRLGRFRLVVRHGEQKKAFTLSQNETIELCSGWLSKSTENLEFSLVYLNVTETAVLKDDYMIEPLKMESITGNFAFTALLQEIEAQQNEQERRIVALEEKIKEYENEGVPLVFEE